MAEADGQRYFVSAAEVAGELHRAMLVARDISLTASNARALALRAGHGAAGFRAITEFIEELARKTVAASKSINSDAVGMSRTASDIARARDALERFERACQKSEGAINASSIELILGETRIDLSDLEGCFSQQVRNILEQLDELGRELRTAVVLSAMSRVEASTSGREFESSLNVIADSVARASEKIQMHVKVAHQLFNDISFSQSRTR